MKSIILKSLFSFIILLVFSTAGFASIKRICKVKYETEEGWSKEYTMEVQFMSGKELNEATKTYDYETYSNYCLIWFSEEKVAILKIDYSIYLTSQKFESDEFKKLFQRRQEVECKEVNSKSERKWIVQGKDFRGFIDPRAKDE